MDVCVCLQKRFPEYPSLSEVDKSQGPEDLQLNGKQYCEVSFRFCWQIRHSCGQQRHVLRCC